MKWTKELPTNKGTFWIRSSEMAPKLCQVWNPFTQPPEVTGQGYEVQFFGTDKIYTLEYYPGLEWYGPIEPPPTEPSPELVTVPINILFDGPPGPESGRFVETETGDGKGISAGEWINRTDEFWALRITELPKREGPVCYLNLPNCEEDCSWYGVAGCKYNPKDGVIKT